MKHLGVRIRNYNDSRNNVYEICEMDKLSPTNRSLDKTEQRNQMIDRKSILPRLEIYTRNVIRDTILVFKLFADSSFFF